MATKKELELELKKYKKAVKARDIVIEELKENHLGYGQLQRMLSAYIIAFVEDNGGKWVVSKERISNIIKSAPPIKTVPTEEEYVLMLEGDEEDEDEVCEVVQES
jgi:hypothetical protein